MVTEKLSKNLVKLRRSKGWTQQDMAKKLQELCGGEVKASPLAVSAWETGSRTPALSTIAYIAILYDTSVDALLGLKRKSAPAEDASEDDSKIQTGPQIRINELGRYDGQPIYVVVPSHQLQDGWAILDYTKKTLVFKDYSVKISPSFEYYAACPPALNRQSAVGHMALTYQDILNMDAGKVVWVELISLDPFAAGQYNGWYKINENATCLINAANSLTLSPSGIGVSFNAYNVAK